MKTRGAAGRLYDLRIEKDIENDRVFAIGKKNSGRGTWNPYIGTWDGRKWKRARHAANVLGRDNWSLK